MGPMSRLDLRKAASAAVITTLALTGCQPAAPIALPDLQVGQSEVAQDGTDYVVRFTVRNAGRAASTGGRIYINAIDPTPAAGQNEIRIQSEVPLPDLAVGAESGQLEARFRVTQLEQESVERFDILVDAKTEVRESDETNNRAEVSLP